MNWGKRLRTTSAPPPRVRIERLRERLAEIDKKIARLEKKKVAR